MRGAVSVRQRAEWLRLRLRREGWESLFENIMLNDAALTLTSIEDALRDVDEALFDENKEKQPVGMLKSQLEDLQEKVGEAHERLHVTESRLKFNIDRLEDLRQEAAKLNRGIQEENSRSKAEPARTAGATTPTTISEGEQKETATTALEEAMAETIMSSSPIAPPASAAG